MRSDQSLTVHTKGPGRSHSQKIQELARTRTIPRASPWHQSGSAEDVWIAPRIKHYHTACFKRNSTAQSWPGSHAFCAPTSQGALELLVGPVSHFEKQMHPAPSLLVHAYEVWLPKACSQAAIEGAVNGQRIHGLGLGRRHFGPESSLKNV